MDTKANGCWWKDMSEEPTRITIENSLLSYVECSSHVEMCAVSRGNSMERNTLVTTRSLKVHQKPISMEERPDVVRTSLGTSAS